MTRSTIPEPAEVVDARGRHWTRSAPFTVVFLDGERMNLPSGWRNGGTTYLSLTYIAEAYGPLKLPDGSRFIPEEER